LAAEVGYQPSRALAHRLVPPCNVDGEISAAELYRRTVARYRQP
jgi:hypothetical protein